MLRRDGHPRRLFLIADARTHLFAAGMERAAGRRRIRLRHGAADGVEARVAITRSQPRDGTQKRLGVWVQRMVEQRVHVGLFNDASQVHHEDTLRHLRDEAQVVGDEENRHAEFVLKVEHQFENLRSGGDVQRGRRLVGDEEIRIAGQRQRDHRPLAHSAAQLVGIAMDGARRIGHAHLPQHSDGLLQRLLFGDRLVQANRFDDLLSNRVDGVEGRLRLLKDQRHFQATDETQHGILWIERGQFHRLRPTAYRAVVENLSGHDASRRRHDAQDRPRHDGLAATALTYQAQRLAAMQCEAGPVHRAHHPFDSREMDVQVFDFEQNRAASGHSQVSFRRGVG